MEIKLNTLLVCFPVLISFLTTCAAVDTITSNQTLKDGDTIVSPDRNFELGFFGSDSGLSINRYVGIWYKKISTGTVVWVANTETPLKDKSGVFRLGQGALELRNGNNTVVWSSNSFGSVTTSDPVARLLDNGNLVVSDGGSFIWQSFDHPGDTLLPGMRIGLDLITGEDRHLKSWKTEDDPSAGQYVLRVDRNGFPQLFERRGSVRYSRFGPWNGLRFSGMSNLREDLDFTHRFSFSKTEIYYEYELVDSTLFSRMRLSPDGNIVRLNWINSTQDWVLYTTATFDYCARYGLCGPYGSCNISNTPACSCLEGFEPRRPEVEDLSSGCQRKTSLGCGNEDIFRKVSGVKFPDTSRSWYNVSMTLDECEVVCRRNCSCTAYGSLNISRGESGCLLWFDDLMDVRVYNETQELYVRIATSNLTSPAAPDSPENGSNNKNQMIAIVVPIILGSIIVCLILAYVAWRKNKRSRTKKPDYSVQARDSNDTNKSHKEDTELLSFSLSTIIKSTNNFSINNKLGQGGFGPVYKGVLENGREIAVKRLSKSSTQGLDEFKNEVECIAKLQHRNLVKLLGYYIQGDERMLIYEYMANKSLDSFIYDKLGSLVIDWPCRFRIIHGIARGILYLHQDSRLRIIHRDLKAGNILLDNDMNPKISDFGLARMFSEYETEANTNRVVGTYGYISPEYAVHGLYSVKSDVFSFGVLVLEMVSGMKNRGFSGEEHNDNLLGYAWRLYKEGKSLELVSSSLQPTCIDSEVLRSTHIGLLCVQNHAEDRPTMSSVVLMLDNENALAPPKQPAFFSDEISPELEAVSPTPTLGSINEVTVSVLVAR